MKLYPGEGFMMGLAGYAQGQPSFNLISREHGEDFGYVEDYPYTYYVSGHKESVELSEQRIKAAAIDDQTPTATIEATLRSVITECIEKYPETSACR